MIRRIVVAGLLVLTNRAQSQTTDPATRALLEKMQARIDSLEKRLAELEKGSAAPHAASAAASAPTVHEAHDAAPVPTQTESAETPTYPSLKIRGFGDIDFASSTLHAPAAGFGAQSLLQPQSGFQEGQFILHMSSGRARESPLSRRGARCPDRRREPGQ
jgi:hypothetical protein